MPLEAKETVAHKGDWGNHMRDLGLLVPLRAVLQGVHLREGLALLEVPHRPFEC